MKKLSMIALMAVLFLVGATNTNALTESELKAKLSQTITVDGKEVKLSNDNLVLIDRYLKENEISSEDADYIASRVDEAIEIIKENKITDLSNINGSAKSELKSLVTAVSKNTDVKATITDGKITVYNTDGKVFTTVSATTSNNTIIKQTGANVSLIVTISAVVIAAGAYVVVRQVKYSK